jgi:tRNA(adenine34) deaminase
MEQRRQTEGSGQDDAKVLDASRATAVDVAMMDRALVLARAAAEIGEIPVGAVVYRTASGEVLGEGSNLRHTQKDPTLHAELIAVQAAAARVGDWRLNECTLVVTLEPCAMCAGLIVNARVGRLVYGCADSKAGACGSLMNVTTDERLNHRVMPIAGVRGEECAEVLRAFFRARRGKDERGGGERAEGAELKPG